jgi:hypothetical protein
MKTKTISSIKLVISTLLALTLVLSTVIMLPLGAGAQDDPPQDPVLPAIPQCQTPQPDALCPDEYDWSPYTTPSWQSLGGNIYRGWYVVHFLNQGTADVYNVTATITYAPYNITILDGVISLGNITAGAGAWSTDDFGIEYDMNPPTPDPQDGIQWMMEYDDAAGNHYELHNVPKFCGESAVIGDYVWLDTNQDGIQDVR